MNGPQSVFGFCGLSLAVSCGRRYAAENWVLGIRVPWIEIHGYRQSAATRRGRQIGDASMGAISFAS